MDIRSRIRQKIKEAQSIKRQNKWNPDNQANIYELDNFLRKSGYRLVDILVHDEYSIPELIIEPVNTDYLHPEISHDVKENNFYAKIVDHGMLVASDIEEIIKGYTTALGVLDHLEKLDLGDLETQNED